MSISLAVIVGGAAGVLGLVILACGLLWFYIVYFKNITNKNSESSSSDPPTQGNKGGRTLTEPQKARQFLLEELEQATKNFNERNLIGEGRFGLVYKGLLCDGTVVAIKMHRGPPKHEFVEEVQYLSEIVHRNLVTLIGYCQEADLQMLVFEYLPNGSISGHLYDTGKESTTRLEFKRRLSAAIGAAKGLSHLHGLMPPLVHKGFKTNNVLVDENFISKVADAGIVRLLQRIDDAGPSQISDVSVFQDPDGRDDYKLIAERHPGSNTSECKFIADYYLRIPMHKNTGFDQQKGCLTLPIKKLVGGFGLLSEKSDVYSFGVFLLELVSGQEAGRFALAESSKSLALWVQEHQGSDNFIDMQMHGTFTPEGMQDFVRLMTQCLSSPAVNRPTMDSVVLELERIYEMEMALTTVMGDGSTIVTLGSQLFTSA